MIEVLGIRGSGKTSKLIELAAEKGYTIVEPTWAAATAIAERARREGFENIDIISASNFIIDKAMFQARERKYLVDELEAFLSVLGIEGYSTTINGPGV